MPAQGGFHSCRDPGLKLIETLRRENGVYPMWRGIWRDFAVLPRGSAFPPRPSSGFDVNWAGSRQQASGAYA